jgi:hypothetical protein
MTAVSEPSRATFSGARGASPSSASNSPGLTMIASAPASFAPSSAAAAKSCQANMTLAAGSVR